MTTACPIWAMLILVAVVHTVGRRERLDYFHTKAFTTFNIGYQVMRRSKKNTNQ